MTYYINQPCGLGDIFFCQKIAYLLTENSKNKVIWPINDNLLYIKDYIKNNTNIIFIPLSSDFKFKEYFNEFISDALQDDSGDIYLPIKNSNFKLSGPNMMSKYKFINGTIENWKDYFNFERNIEKENNLYYNILNLTDESIYNVINKQYGTLPNIAIKNEVQSDNSFININIEPLSNISVFDWCKVLENAQNIFTVDTCFMFIIEKLKFKYNINLNVWSRHTPTNFEDVVNLFSKNWNFKE